MTTKESIIKELDAVPAEHLDELGKLIKRFIASKNGDQTESLLSKLKRVEIHGPADFAKNLDGYLNGEVFGE